MSVNEAGSRVEGLSPSMRRYTPPNCAPGSCSAGGPKVCATPTALGRSRELQTHRETRSEMRTGFDIGRSPCCSSSAVSPMGELAPYHRHRSVLPPAASSDMVDLLQDQ